MRNLEEIKHFLETLYSFSFIPVYVVESESCTWACQEQECVYIPESVLDIFRKDQTGLQVLETSVGSYYGKIPMEGSAAFIVIGPVKPNVYLESELSGFFFQYHIPADRRPMFTQQLRDTPCYTLLQLHHLLLHLGLTFCPQNKRINTYHDMDLENFRDENYSKQRQAGYEGEREVNFRVLREMYSPMIREGNLEGLIQRARHQGPLYYGEYSTDARKNQLLVMMIGVTSTMMAAIDGGMPDQEAYLLMKHYVQLALNAKTAAQIDEISMRCSLHFVGQVRKYKDAQIQQNSLYDCVQYIRNKVYEPIKASDVAKFSGYSEAHFSKLFRKQMGIGAAEFIYQCKLLEARSLLESTDQSVGEISESLYFANQSHFQRKFKEQYGVTPLQYRSNFRSEQRE